MKSVLPFSATGLLLAVYSGLNLAAVDEPKVDDFFSMTPAELAAIPVTIATGTPNPVFQSAAVTSVITAEQIKSMGATELHEVLETVPGVHASLQENSFDYSYTVRGIRNATNSQILIMLNGTRISTPFVGTLMTSTELPIDAIERVEVIRGPGSALYGADAFAGVINIITKKANDIKGTKVGVRGGSSNSQSTWAQHGGQWAGWDVATSLQYQHTTGDDKRIVTKDAQTGLDEAFHTHASLAPGALNTGYKMLNGHLNLQRKHWDIGLWAYSSWDVGTRAGNAGALDNKGDFSGEQYLADIRYSTEDLIKDWELTAHASYLDADFGANVQLFPNNALLPIKGDGNIGTSPGFKLISFPQGLGAYVGRHEQIPAIELGSVYRGFEQHLLRFSTGFRYEMFHASELANFGPGVLNQPFPAVVSGKMTDITDTRWIYLPDTKRSIWSFVAQDEWRFADDWLLTAGLRYDDYSDFGGTLNPRAALVWNATSQLTTKLLYGRAFRAPNFSEQHIQNNPVVIGNNQLSPETINTYEWAIDYRPSNSLRTAVNIYYYQIKNLISAITPSSTGANRYQNNGNQNGFGSEFEWDWQLHDKLSIKGNYAWQRAINEETNERVIGVPEHHIYAAAVWRFLPQWQLQPQVNWIAGRTVPDQAQALADYETVDLTLRGKKLWGQIDFSASIRNLFDTRYRESTPQLPENLPMPGRSFYLETSINF